MKNLFFCSLFLLSVQIKGQAVVKHQNDYFAFGISYGNCGGDCATFFIIQNGNLFSDKITEFVSQIQFSEKALSQSKYLIAKQLWDKMPEYLRKNPDKTFGCPNCVDQGQVYIEVREKGKVMYWNIDTEIEQQPKEIQAYIKLLYQVLEQL